MRLAICTQFGLWAVPIPTSFMPILASLDTGQLVVLMKPDTVMGKGYRKKKGQNEHVIYFNLAARGQSETALATWPLGCLLTNNYNEEKTKGLSTVTSTTGYSTSIRAPSGRSLTTDQMVRAGFPRSSRMHSRSLSAHCSVNQCKCVQ